MDIKLLKAGETGFGYLVEYDAGYISPSDERNKKVIREFEKIDIKTPDDKLVVYVVLQKYNVKNRNGRIYPEEILRKQNEIYQEAIQARRAIGELDHPESSVISGERVSHNIIKTWWEGHTLMGQTEILMTKGYINYGIVSTSGDKVAELLRNNIMIGVSSRGVGSLKEVKGDFIVQDDFELICWDVVTAPSTPGSWMFKNREEAKPYMENVETKKTNLIENLDKFLLT
jgi:Prohead core protein serine protease